VAASRTADPVNPVSLSISKTRAAIRAKDIAFLISISGTGVPGAETTIDQARGQRDLGPPVSTVHAALRRPYRRRNQAAIWFQLAKVRVTSLRSRFSRRLAAGVVAKRRVGGPLRSPRASAGQATHSQEPRVFNTIVRRCLWTRLVSGVPTCRP